MLMLVKFDHDFMQMIFQLQHGKKISNSFVFAFERVEVCTLAILVKIHFALKIKV